MGAASDIVTPVMRLWLWNLPMPLLLALRYARSTRKDASIRFLSGVTAAGIALGVAALILAVAALSGFQATLLEETLARSPLLQVELAEDVDTQAVRRTVTSQSEVHSAQLVLLGSGWIVHGGRLQPAELVGVEGRVPSWLPGAAGQPVAGLFVPDLLALRWGLVPGEGVRVVSPRPTLTPFSRQLPRSRKIPVAGTYDGGRSEEHAERIVLPLQMAESLLWGSDRRLDLELEVAHVTAVAARLRRALPAGARVVTYRDLNRSLFFALRMEKVLMFVGVFLIVLVASQALISSLALVIASKRRELGMLGTLGMTPSEMRRTFLALGALLALVGIVGGGGVGCLAAWLLDRYRVLSLPQQVYIVDWVPFLLRPAPDLSIIFIATLALTLLAARSAGGRAAAIIPAEALRR